MKEPEIKQLLDARVSRARVKQLLIDLKLEATSKAAKTGRPLSPYVFPARGGGRTSRPAAGA